MNPPSEDITDYLTSSSVGFTLGTDLFVTMLPDGPNVPDTCIGIVDTGGWEPEPAGVEFPTVQILGRGIQGQTGYKTIYTMMETAADALHMLDNIIINTAYYLHFYKATEISFLGYDEKGRPMFSCNLRIARRTN